SFGDANDDMFSLMPWEDGGTYNVYGSGSDIWGGGDNFHFLFNEISGSFAIWGSDALLFQENGDGTWAKGGFMVRDDLDNNAANGFAMVRTDMQFRLQYRPEKGVDSQSGGGVGFDQHNGNFGLIRVGNTVMAAYKDADGNVQIEGQAEVELTDPVWVGIAITSHVNDSFSSLAISDPEFQDVDGLVSRSMPNKGLPTGGGTSEGITVTVELVEGVSSNATVTEILPEGFTAENITTTNGDASASGNTITWNLSGAEGTVEMTYDAVIPDVANDVYTFSGEMQGIPTGGDASIVPIFFQVPFVADANVALDGEIGDDEYAGGYTETFSHEEGDTTPPGITLADTKTYPADENNVTFHVVHNAEYIWVGVDVVDYDLAFDENADQAYNNDSVEFYFDGNLSRATTKEGGPLGFQATVMGNGRLIGGNDAPGRVEEAGGLVVAENQDNYWIYATKVKEDESGWITEYRLTKSEVLDPVDNTVCGFDFKMNGSEPGAGGRTSNWGYWLTDFEGNQADAFWDDETGWAICDLGVGYTNVMDWSLY
ncbi:hypothetical protein GF373_08315, partial [bacterium]|nr:hypothetical protein [bacterium]